MKKLFFALIFLIPIIMLLSPDKPFSESENRVLAGAPELSLSALASGTFMRGAETYTADQFPFRNAFVAAKAVAERAMLKTENNGVYFAENGSLAERIAAPNAKRLAASIDAVNSIAATLSERGIETYVALIPNSNAFFELPANAPDSDQAAVIADIYGKLNVTATVPVYETLSEHANEYIFFRTDHHWTALGAYYGYAQTVRAMNIAPSELRMENGEVRVDGTGNSPLSFRNYQLGDFYGSAHSKAGAPWIEPDEFFALMPPYAAAALDFNDGDGKLAFVYNPEQLTHKNKYAFFLGGNSPRRVFFGLAGRNSVSTAEKKLLIVRDSFTDIELPYFLPHFAEVHLLDLRYWRGNIADYAADNDIGAVLFNYNVRNFCEETNLGLAQHN